MTAEHPGGAGRAMRGAWIAWWRARQRYHRYTVSGLEHLLTPGPKLIVGYHGKPIAHDLCMLQIALYDRLGYLPHPVFHAYFGQNPALRAFIDALGFVTGDGEDLARAVARGEHVMVTPGGTREGCRSSRHRYAVRWGERMGYLRVALKYGLPIVPVAARGTDDLYLGLNDGDRTARRLGVPAGLPLWLGLGLVGAWPLAVPFPARIRQVVGAPIDPRAGGPVDPDDREALRPLHAQVVGAVQGLLDGAR